jgi:HK97 family phage major capsid protein
VICDMWSRCSTPGSATWFINADVQPQLYTMGLTLGTGGAPVYLPQDGAAGRPLSTLFGRPIVISEVCSTLGTVGDVVLASMGDYYLIDKPIQAAASIHVAYLTDQVALRFVYRCDGSPAWKAALTPFRGTSTVSPFCALESRD